MSPVFPIFLLTWDDLNGQKYDHIDCISHDMDHLYYIFVAVLTHLKHIFNSIGLIRGHLCHIGTVIHREVEPG